MVKTFLGFLFLTISQFAIAQNTGFETQTKNVGYDVDSLLALKATTTNPIFKDLGKAIKGSGFSMKGYWIWDGCAVKGEDGKYHLYCSRWPDSLLMHPAWMATSEIIHCVADKAEGPYQFVSTIFTARGAQYWDGRSTFNPQVFKHKGKYYMFYTGSTHPFEEPTAKAFDLKYLSSRKYLSVNKINQSIFRLYNRQIIFEVGIIKRRTDTKARKFTSSCISHD